MYFVQGINDAVYVDKVSEFMAASAGRTAHHIADSAYQCPTVTMQYAYGCLHDVSQGVGPCAMAGDILSQREKTQLLDSTNLHRFSVLHGSTDVRGLTGSLCNLEQ